MREGIVREFGMARYTQLCLKRVTNEDLVYSTGNFAQHCVAARVGGEAGGTWVSIVYIYG